VEFEDVLSISVLQNKATCHQNSQLEIVKFEKKGPSAHFISNPAFGKLYCATFLGHAFSSERHEQSYFKFNIKQYVIPIRRMMSNILSLLVSISGL
jgi:hypothetical protein